MILLQGVRFTERLKASGRGMIRLFVRTNYELSLEFLHQLIHSLLDL